MSEHLLPSMNRSLFARKGEAVPAILTGGHSSTRPDAVDGVGESPVSRPHRSGPSPLSFLIHRQGRSPASVSSQEAAPKAQVFTPRFGEAGRPRQPLCGTKLETNRMLASRQRTQRRQLTVRLTLDEFRRFEAAARSQRTTFQSLMETGINRYLDVVMPEPPTGGGLISRLGLR